VRVRVIWICFTVRLPGGLDTGGIGMVTEIEEKSNPNE
jgi:hypothetical protein